MFKCWIVIWCQYSHFVMSSWRHDDVIIAKLLEFWCFLLNFALYYSFHACHRKGKSKKVLKFGCWNYFPHSCKISGQYQPLVLINRPKTEGATSKTRVFWSNSYKILSLKISHRIKLLYWNFLRILLTIKKCWWRMIFQKTTSL